MAVTEAGDLLVSDLAPFRITRYAAGLGSEATVLIEDESILSVAEFGRALPGPEEYRDDWSRSVYLDEMADGSVLNVLRVSQSSMFRRTIQPRWVVVSGTGDVLADERTAYFPLAAGEGDSYLAATQDGDLAMLAVSLENAVRRGSRR